MTSEPVESLRANAADLMRAGKPAAGLLVALDGIARFPDDPDLLRIAGNCALVTGDHEAAIAWYSRAIAANPRAIEPRVNLGLIHRTHHRVADARRVLRECLACDPANRAAWLNLVSTYVNEGETEAGEALAREAIHRCGELPELQWNLALLLLERQAWREGWSQYATRANLPGFFPRPWAEVDQRRRLVDLGRLRSADTVVCHGEQGLGDEILFAGMLREFAAAVRARGATLALACNPRLNTVFARSFDMPLVDATRASTADWVVAIGDLGRFLRNEPADFPLHRGYLAVDAGRVARLRAELSAQAGGRPLVGLAWSGGLPRTHGEFRRIPLATWLPLLRQEAVFVSLQYRDDHAEVDALRRQHGIDIVRLPHVTQDPDYGETFSLVAALDLVVTVPTSVLHVAGAIGRDCFVVMDRRAAWRECATGGRLPWYPLTHERFVRGADDGPWEAAMAAISKAFARRVNDSAAMEDAPRPVS